MGISEPFEKYFEITYLVTFDYIFYNCIEVQIKIYLIKYR